MSIERLYNRIKHAPPFQDLAQRLSEGANEISMRGASGSLSAFVLAWIQEQTPGTVLVVCPDEDRAEALRNDLERLIGADAVGYFPGWDVAHFDGRSPHRDVVGLRLEALDQLRGMRGGIVVAPIAALMGHTLPPDLFDMCVQTVQVGSTHSPVELADHLVEIGYERVSAVEGVGQFSMRGGILDVCSFGNANPVRIEFWDDEVASIRAFDIGTQRSVAPLEEVRILPCREFVLPLAMSDVYLDNLTRAEQAL